VVLVSKLDAWEHLLPEPLGAEPYLESPDALRMSVDRVEVVSKAVRALLLQHCPDVVMTAEGLTEAVRYIPVSSLGRAPDLVERDGQRFYGVRPADVRPRWATVPVAYCLARWAPGLLTADRPASDDTIEEPIEPGGPSGPTETPSDDEIPLLAASGEFGSGHELLDPGGSA
jgi:hypothetical protein